MGAKLQKKKKSNCKYTYFYASGTDILCLPTLSISLKVSSSC